MPSLDKKPMSEDELWVHARALMVEHKIMKSTGEPVIGNEKLCFALRKLLVPQKEK